MTFIAISACLMNKQYVKIHTVKIKHYQFAKKKLDVSNSTILGVNNVKDRLV